MSSQRLPINPEDIQRWVHERVEAQMNQNHSFLGPVMRPMSIQGHSSVLEGSTTVPTTSYAVAPTGFGKQEYEQPYPDGQLMAPPYYHHQLPPALTTTATGRPLLSLAPIRHPSSPSLVGTPTMLGSSSASPLNMESRYSIDTDSSRPLPFHHSSGLPINAMYATQDPLSMTTQARPTGSRPTQSGPQRWRVRPKPTVSPYDAITPEERKKLLGKQFRQTQQTQQVSPQMPVSNSPVTTSESAAISQSVGPNYDQHSEMTHSHYPTHPQVLPNDRPAPTSNEPLPSGQPLSSSPTSHATMHTGINFIRDYKPQWDNLHPSVHLRGPRAVETTTPNINIYAGSQAYAPSPSTSTRSNNNNKNDAAMLPPSTEDGFINSNVGSSHAVLDPSHDCATYRTFFPLQTEAHRRLRVSMHEVMTSRWKLRHELEPTPHDMLQFSQKSVGDDGTAIYRCLLYHNGVACDRTWTRAERILAHLRREIDLRPFVCDGENDVCACGSRFFAEDTLQQHRKNVNTVPCTYCAMVTPRNIKRHLKHNCQLSPDRVR